MAGVINSIRNRAGLVFGLIVLSLVIFTVSSVLTQQSLFQEDYTVVGVIGGQEVRIDNYQQKVQGAIFNAEQNGQRKLSEQEKEQVLNEVWERQVTDILFSLENEDLGLQVTVAESNQQLLGPNPNPIMMQIPAFRNGTGQFDPNLVKQLISNSRQAGQEQLAAQLGQLQTQVNYTRLLEKYYNMLQAATFVSTEEARLAAFNNVRQATINYLAINYATIPDSAVEVSQSDLMAYYNEHKNRFRQPQPETIIRYVYLSKLPTAADSAATRAAATKAASELVAAESDTTYALANSDEPIEPIFRNVMMLDEEARKAVENAKPGTVLPPSEVRGGIRVFKVMAFKNDTLNMVKARHILIQPASGSVADSVAARALADSLARVATPENFSSLAIQFSDDNQTRYSGGELGVLPRGVLGAEFDEAVGKAGKGIIRKAVASRGGFHIIDVQESSNRMVQLAAVIKRFEPSNETIRLMDSKANEFAARLQGDAARFDTVAQNLGLDVRTSGPIVPQTTLLPGIAGSNSIIGWALQNDINAVSNVTPTNDGFIIAFVKEKNVDGYRSLSSVEAQIRPDVIRRKKAKMIMEKLGDTNGKTLEQLRGTYGQGAFTGNAQNITLNAPGVPGVGSDNIVVGAAFALKKGQRSKPVEGLTGVYVLEMQELTEPAALTEEQVKQYQANLLQQRRNLIIQRVSQGMRETGNVKDLRYRHSL